MFDVEEEITFEDPLTFRNAFLFPLQSPESRREILIGAAWLLLPFVGWLMNIGHRILITHALLHNEEGWPSWTDYGRLLYHGFVTFAGMVLYHMPALLLRLIAWFRGSMGTAILAALFWMVAVTAIPGCMTHYSYTLDPWQIVNPIRAVKRVIRGGACI